METNVKSDSIDFIAFIIWVVLSLVFAWRFKKPRHVFLASSGLSAIGISISTYRQGSLDGGGIIHIVCAGLMAVGFFYLLKSVRSPKDRP